MATLDSIFDQTSQCYEDKIAVTFNSGSVQEHSTYKEIKVQASGVAEFLETQCDGQETIAIYSKQSIGLISCILGVLKSRNCFAPIDLNWLPGAICKFLLKLNVDLVLLDEELHDSFQKCLLQWKTHSSVDSKIEFVRNQKLDGCGFILVRGLREFKGSKVNTECQGLAYVMQTSGTTGDPKAVKVPHRCIVPNITDLRSIFQVTSDDVVFLTSPYTFDPFIVQMFITFAAGARLVIVPDSIKIVPSKLCHVLFDEEKVTILQPTPSLMYHIGQELIQSKILNEDSSLRVLAFGGESCPTLSTLRQWRSSQSSTAIYNLYGITEVSCWASCYQVTDFKLEDKTGPFYENSTSEHGDVEDCLVAEVNDVPLGSPLSDTMIEVRDENGKCVEEGMGQIYIGGSDRVCLLADETLLHLGTMRATGDWACVKDNRILYRGCKDRQVKRMGKRINLDWIERQISEKIPERACSLVLEKTFQSKPDKLHLFVAEKSLAHNNDKLSSLKSNIMNLLPVDSQPDFVHIIHHLPLTAHGKINRDSLLVGVQKTTKHKDVSARDFLRYAWNEVLEVNKTNSEQETYTENIEKQPDSFHETKPKDVKDDDMFTTCGGTSLSAVRLADLIESFASEQKGTKIDFSELLDFILTKPFGALCSYVEQKLANRHERKGQDSKETLHGNVNANGNSLTTIATAPTVVSSQRVPVLTVKRKFSSMVDASSLEDDRVARKIQSSVKNDDLSKKELLTQNHMKSCFCSVYRRNQWTICEICKYSTINTASHASSKPKTFSSCQSSAQDSTMSCEVVMAPIKAETLRQSSSVNNYEALKAYAANSETRNCNSAEEEFSITCWWKTCLYKCIDASPLVVYAPGRFDGEVFIGSHSHMFMCVRLSDGKVVWERRLGDRIESSAAVSRCGGYVVVGCYDGKVYILNRFTGETFWTFQTGAAVKSSPCIDPQTGVAWVGSHDHHLYALDVTNKLCVCTIDCGGGGSCFSSPCISNEPHLVFIATLTGSLLAIDATEHAVLWSQQCPKPVFASPLVTPTGIVCACVDGFVYCLGFWGIKLWQFETCASVFCSPTLYHSAECDPKYPDCIVFGSHDKSLYCLSLDGELLWSFSCDGPVYSSPFVAQLKVNSFCHTTCNAICSSRRYAQIAVIALSSVGTLYVLDLYSGVLLASYSLPGEVFSSPVVVDNQILIGCRDDYLYSLKISQRN